MYNYSESCNIFKEKYRTHLKNRYNLLREVKNLIKTHTMFLDEKAKYCKADNSFQNNLKFELNFKRNENQLNHGRGMRKT